jgi:hypothetical protein
MKTRQTTDIDWRRVEKYVNSRYNPVRQEIESGLSFLKTVDPYIYLQTHPPKIEITLGTDNDTTIRRNRQRIAHIIGETTTKYKFTAHGKDGFYFLKPNYQSFRRQQ